MKLFLVGKRIYDPLGFRQAEKKKESRLKLNDMDTNVAYRI